MNCSRDIQNKEQQNRGKLALLAPGCVSMGTVYKKLNATLKENIEKTQYIT